jgi:hypothetical protein
LHIGSVTKLNSKGSAKISTLASAWTILHTSVWA